MRWLWGRLHACSRTGVRIGCRMDCDMLWNKGGLRPTLNTSEVIRLRQSCARGNRETIESRVKEGSLTRA